jgi:hypothetical protein
MLLIRQAQRISFQAATLQHFEDKMVRYVAAEYPDKYKRWREPKTRDLVRKGIEAGRQNGITQEGALMSLIDLFLQFGVGFELSPEQGWALEILAHETLPCDAKIQIIAERFHELSGGRRIEEAGDDDN